jgi:hypothetical protein
MLLLALACANPDVDDTHVDTEPPAVDHVAAVAERLSGRFDSSAQAAEDRTYYNISLVTCAVSAPELGDTVLYVEQAVADTPSEPYRQRLYVVAESTDGAATTIFELDRPADAVGLCDGSDAPTYTAADVDERVGCGVILTVQDDGSYTGSTEPEACGSDLNGATWASSIVTLTQDRVESWDQGWDDQGTQVWGATAGPYVFDRIE